MNYQDATQKLGTRESRKVGNNTYLQRRSETALAVKLHATDVLTFHADGRIVYQTGGWRTVTTRDRMNAFGPLRLWTKRGVWYVREGVVYADGLTVHANGSITGASDAPDERGDKRAIKKFVAAYLAAFERGEVPAPSGADCWYCSMCEVGSGRPLGEIAGGGIHIREHFRESYFVPTLLSRALEVFGASQAQRQWVAAHWDKSAPADEAKNVRESSYFADHGRRNCVKMLRRYVSRQLGYAA